MEDLVWWDNVLASECELYCSISTQSGADENLGKVWFYGSIDRDKAVELLMKSERFYSARKVHRAPFSAVSFTNISILLEVTSFVIG